MDPETRRPSDPPPGECISTQPRDTDSEVRAEGRLVSLKRFFITVDFAEGHPWAIGDEVVLGFGPEEYRFAALAKVKDESPEGTKLMRLSPWRPVNTRAFPRIELDAPVVASCDGVEVSGHTVNLSFGGLALELDQPAEGNVSSVRVGDLDFMNVTEVSPARPGQDEILHLAFVEPNEQQLWDIESFMLRAAPGVDEPGA